MVTAPLPSVNSQILGKRASFAECQIPDIRQSFLILPCVKFQALGKASSFCLVSNSRHSAKLPHFAFHVRVGFFSRDFVPAVQWLREFPFLRQVVIDRRMILVLPGRRQRFICFSCTEKIYYLFLIFIRTSKYARALQREFFYSIII